MPKNPAIVKTIVTTNLQDDIAKLEYYESRNNDILSYTESLFNTKLDLIKAYIIYMRVIQGGGYL